jgi:hypothetical protein
MTSPDPMTRDELLEMAPLDALGLLDDYDAALFHRAFHHAPATVQAEIRSIQAEISVDPSFLAVDEPRPSLKAKVLARVADEIDESAEQLKPLATIGSAAHASRSAATRDDSAMAVLVEEIRARTIAPSRDRSTPYWRAASFFLAASLVVSLYFLTRTMRHAETVAQLAQNQVINEELRQLVPDLTDFAYRDSVIRGLSSVSSSANAAATLYIDRANGRAFLLALGLNESKGPFTLRAVDERGNATVIATFSAKEPVAGYLASHLPDDILSRKLEVLDADGAVILRTA